MFPKRFKFPKKTLCADPKKAWVQKLMKRLKWFVLIESTLEAKVGNNLLKSFQLFSSICVLIMIFYFFKEAVNKKTF